MLYSLVMLSLTTTYYVLGPVSWSGQSRQAFYSEYISGKVTVVASGMATTIVKLDKSC